MCGVVCGNSQDLYAQAHTHAHAHSHTHTHTHTHTRMYTGVIMSLTQPQCVCVCPYLSPPLLLSLHSPYFFPSVEKKNQKKIHDC